MPRFAFAAYESGRSLRSTCAPGGSSAGTLPATFATTTSSSTCGASTGRSSASSEACPCETTTAETVLIAAYTGVHLHIRLFRSCLERLAVDLGREPRRLLPAEPARALEPGDDPALPLGEGALDRAGELGRLRVEDRVA